MTFSDFSSFRSKSKYPQIAVKGVRKSWKIFVTASFSSRSPSRYHLRCLRSSRSCLFRSDASSRICLSLEDIEIRVFVSVFSQSASCTRISVMPTFSVWIFTQRIRTMKDRILHKTHGKSMNIPPSISNLSKRISESSVWKNPKNGTPTNTHIYILFFAAFIEAASLSLSLLLGKQETKFRRLPICCSPDRQIRCLPRSEMYLSTLRYLVHISSRSGLLPPLLWKRKRQTDTRLEFFQNKACHS